MIMYRLLIVLSLLLLAVKPSLAQTIVTFDDQGWNPDQPIPSDFTIGNFKVSSTDSLYTNYGYNFNVYNTSIYYVFNNQSASQITITTVDNELVKLNSIAAYQVSETGTDTLIIEGWNGSNKKYSTKFSNTSEWKTLTINYDSINKVVVKVENLGNGALIDYNFDNISISVLPTPVELNSFSANVTAKSVKLDWSTSTETNNFGFDVQRKYDAIEWQTIGSVKGNGTTTQTQYYSFYDDLSNYASSKIYYRLKQIDLDGSFTYSDEISIDNNIASSFKLEQNYPNPFNPSTEISWQSPVSSWQTLKVYDVLGNEVATLVDEQKEAGSYSATFSAKGGSANGGDTGNLSSGIYIYKLSVTGGAVNYIETKKMILLH